MSTTEALKDGEQHWEFCESVIISSEIIFMFGLNEFHWTAKTCALIWTLFPSTSYNLTLLWPFWLAPFTLTWWCQVTGRYLVEERIFSVVLDLSLRGWGGGASQFTSGTGLTTLVGPECILLLWAALSARCAHLLSPSIINPSALALNQHN